MELKFMEPQSRWMIKTLFSRDYDSFVDRAKARTNLLVLVADVVAVLLLIRLL